MCRHTAWSFAPQASAPAAARRAVRDDLTGVVVAEAGTLVDDAILVVSELVTNAIVAGCQWVEVQLTVHHNHLILEVSDDAPGRPRLSAPAPFRAGGRGLQLIDRLARAWAVHDDPAGKTVYVELAIRPGTLRGLLCDPSIT